MSKLRVYMVGKELGIDNKALVAMFQAIGATDVRNHMSAVAPEQVERVRRHISKHGDDEHRQTEERVQPQGGAGAVIIRRGKKADGPEPRGPERGPSREEEAAARPAAPAVVRRQAPSSATHERPRPPSEPAVHEPSVQAAPPTDPQVEREAARTPIEAPPVSEASPAPVSHTPERDEPVHAAPSARPAPTETGFETQPDPISNNRSSAGDDPEPSLAAPPTQPTGGQLREAEVRRAAQAGEITAQTVAATQPVRAQTQPEPPVVATAPAQASASPAVPSAPPLSMPAGTAPGATRAVHTRPAARPEERQAPARAEAPAGAQRPSSPPRTGIEVWEGRPGVPMPQAPRGGMAPRRVQYDAKSGAGAGPAGQRRGAQMSGPNNRGGVRGGPARRGIGALAGRRPLGTAASVTQERSAHKKIVKIEGNIAVQALAGKMGIKGAELLMKLLGLGMTGVNINTTLDSDTAKIVSAEFGWTVEDVAVSEDAAIAAAQGGETAAEDGERVPRPPVVTVMGHVDHGKTSLLDKIRKAQVASGEAGGITQHIGAYSVKTPQGRITFLDTPGHEAFTQMRARGAKCTDIVVLVVAADDGVMPQTKEAINHARDANCPIVVAINKIDKPEAQPDRVRRELSEVGLMPEEWGGDTLFCEVSAHSGAGIEQLLDTILLQAEVLDLRANPNRHARGTVIEAKLDRGRGPVATVLVLEGTLRKGDGVLVGNSWGRVRAMLDDSGRNLADAGPATPVAIIGLSEVPSAGDNVDAVDDAKKAQQIAEQRKVKVAEKARGSTTKVSLEELARRMSQADQKDLKVIVKADVQGSVEALNTALEKLSTDKVKVTVVHSGVGAITEGDVNLAVASGALIIGFNTRPAGKARDLAQREGIEIRQYSVIYDVTDDVRASMEGLLAPTLVEEPIGEAEVRRIFKVSKAGVVAGCMVIKGVVRRNSMVRLRRNDSVIWEGKLDSLKRFKDDAKEVREGFDCGISFQGYSDLQEGDLIAAFEMKEVRPTL